MLTFTTLVIFFTAYSFVGWIWELVFIYMTERWWHLRAFLTLPLLPIYGASALGIILVVEPYIHNPFLVFVAAAAIVTVVEFMVSFALDKLFRVRLWDYSTWPFNLNGRISMFSSLGFGFLGLFLLYVLHPFFKSVVLGTSPTVIVVVGWILFVLLVIDFINSFSSLLRVRIENIKLQGTLDDIQSHIDAKIKTFRGNNRKLRTALEKWHRFNIRRTRKAFPNARTLRKK